MQVLRHMKNLWLGACNEAHILGNEEDSDSRRGIFISALLYNIVLGILNGAYLSSFCLSMGADANGVNAAVLIMSLSNLVQIFAPLLLERLNRKKRFLIVIRSIAHLINLLFIPLLAILGTSGGMLLVLSIVLLGIAQCLLAFISPGLQVWHIANIPGNKRLGYFSLFSIINCIATYLALFISGLAVDHFVGILGPKAALSGMRFFLLILAVGDIFFLTKIREHESSNESFPNLKSFLVQMIRCLKDCPNYGKIIAVASIWNLVANLPSQYYNTYLISELKLSYTLINSVTLFNVLAVTVCTPIWKRIISWKGLSGCLFWSLLLYAPHAFGLALVGPSTIYLYPLSIFYNLIFAAGINLCFSMVPYVGLPEKRKGMYMALYNTCCAISALIGILLGRGIFTLLISRGDVVIGGSTIAPARILLVVFGIFAAAASFIFFKLLRSSGADN